MVTHDLYVGRGHGLGARLVEEEAVGGRDHVLGGHQRAAADEVARPHVHHPGVLVLSRSTRVKHGTDGELLCYSQD